MIVDAPAAGHAISFLLSARGLLDAVRVGPVQKQAQDVVALLSDPARCQVVLVTLPEETPVSEVIDTAFAIEDRAGVALGPDRRQPVLPAVAGGSRSRMPTRSSAARDSATASCRSEKRTTSRTRPRSAENANRCSARSSSGLRERLPLPQIRLPFVFSPDVTRPQLDVLAQSLTCGIERL